MNIETNTQKKLSRSEYLEDYIKAIRIIEDAEQLVVDAVSSYQDYITESTGEVIDHDEAEERLKSLWAGEVHNG